MKLATSSQMKELDRIATEKFGVPSLDLMEKAGAGVAEIVRKFFKKGPVAIFAGKGNNGGDGLVAARYLKDLGFNVTVYIVSPWTEFSKDSRVNWDRLAGKDIPVVELSGEPDIKKHAGELEKSVCIVDAIFGTGLAQEVRGRHKTIIEFINSLSKPVVAVDIPSGLSADTGEPLGVAIRARHTVTFGLAKVGLMTSTGRDFSKDVHVIDIGIPKEAADSLDTGFYLSSPSAFAGIFPPRPKDSHKGDFGHVVVIGGSAGKIGAGLLACRAALRSGAGLVTYALPNAAFAKFDTKSPEVMYEGLPDKGSGYLRKDALPALKSLLRGKGAVVLGPGIGTEAETRSTVKEIISKNILPIVLDADGLNCVAGDVSAFDTKKHPVVFTPHPGEMSRLTGQPTAEIQKNRIEAAKKFAKAYHVFLVLKGSRTVIATPDGTVFINPTGNPAMASAGTGDVLSGVIAGLIAQKIPFEKAVVAGVYLHGLAGDMAAKEIGERGVIASDLIGLLPRAIGGL